MKFSLYGILYSIYGIKENMLQVYQHKMLPMTKKNQSIEVD